MNKSQEKRSIKVVEFLKKSLIVLSVIANIVLAVLYARTEAQYSLYKEFVAVDKAHYSVPTLPELK